ncbi:MAG: ATP-binding protein, partial [Cyanobacteria bacterium J06642_11]
QTELDEADLEFLQEDLPKTLKSMQLGTDRIREIVLSLRNFSRTDEAEFKAVDIHAGIESTLLILQHRIKAQSKRPEIRLDKRYGDLPLVKCYPGPLNQVFMNIIANAIDAIDEHHENSLHQHLDISPNTITIQTTVTPDAWIRVEIANDGDGIPEDIQLRIFDPFFTTKPVGKGTGMGMSISYKIVTENHGGKLNCVSKPNEGVTFIIEIPNH